MGSNPQLIFITNWRGHLSSYEASSFFLGIPSGSLCGGERALTKFEDANISAALPSG